MSDSWVDEINKETKSNSPSLHEDLNEQWKKHSIYKIPTRITELNEKAYKPQVISFGPYHHGEKHLEAMEEHKHRALIRFLKACKKPIELLTQEMNNVVSELRDSYQLLDSFWISNTHEFIKMMILDGCFIWEILIWNEHFTDEYKNQVTLENYRFYGMSTHIKHDLLLLENQLPLMVLLKLVQFQYGVVEEEDYDWKWLNLRIVKLVNPGTPSAVRFAKSMHILDVYRKSLMQLGAPSLAINMEDMWVEEGFHQSTIELHEAGIHFKDNNTWSLNNITFEGDTLRLPILVVNDTTEYKFLNLIAFEHLHLGTDNEVTSYVYFMNTMIKSEMDIAHLKQNGIIINALGRDKDVYELFNSLCKETTLRGSIKNNMVMKNLDAYYNKNSWKIMRANFIKTYFKNPWTIVSLVAAIFLFLLTIVQTTYSVLQFYE